MLHFTFELAVDNSRQVARCWELTKNYFATSQEKDAIRFVDDFIVYLQKNDFYHLSMDVCDTESTLEFRALLLKLINDKSLEYVKKMVNESLIIKQSWGHIDTFNKIRETYSDIDIYAYPSNIIHSIRDAKIQKEVASCVEALSPKLSIQTNLFNGAPTKVHLISDNSVVEIMNTLGPGPFLQEENNFSHAENAVYGNDKTEVNSHSFFASPNLNVQGTAIGNVVALNPD